MFGLNFVGKIDHKIINFSLEPGKEEDPALFLYKEGRFGRCAIIPLESAFKYNEPKTFQEKRDVMTSCLSIANALDLPKDVMSLSQIASQVQDKLDDLVKASPDEMPAEYAGTADITLNGEQFTHEVSL